MYVDLGFILLYYKSLGGRGHAVRTSTDARLINFFSHFFFFSFYTYIFLFGFSRLYDEMPERKVCKMIFATARHWIKVCVVVSARRVVIPTITSDVCVLNTYTSHYVGVCAGDRPDDFESGMVGGRREYTSTVPPRPIIREMGQKHTRLTWIKNEK